MHYESYLYLSYIKEEWNPCLYESISGCFILLTVTWVNISISLYLSSPNFLILTIYLPDFTPTILYILLFIDESPFFKLHKKM